MKINVLRTNALTLLALALFITSCGGSSGSSSSSSSTPPVAYCSTQSSYSSGFTFTGTARYYYRADGNGAITGPNPIRRAEVRVVDSSGQIIQCGETNDSGQFTLELPTNGSTATISVTSRADNSYVKAYILKNPTDNTHHEVAATITLDGATTSATFSAKATGAVTAGAFNILDKILDANAYLKNATSGCGSSYTNCTSFSVAPLVNVYWSAGVNPSSYFSISSPLSFYIPERNELYILGGVNGDVDNSDTDHFDNSIILHEYGHYIENTYAETNSPGGFHNGNMILDPRLAWGEGWANFFQAVVLGTDRLRDTYGTTEGVSGVYANVDLEDESGPTGSTTDRPQDNGEGNFREFSVTRALFDVIDNSPSENSSKDDLSADFAEFWTVFTDSSVGFTKSNLNFRSIGLYYDLQNSYVDKSDWSTIQSSEKQSNAQDNYANTLGNSSCTTDIQAENMPYADSSLYENGTPENSNQFHSNDFYQYTHSGGALTITMSYTTSSSGSGPADLDIYLYKNDYIFGDADSVLGYSDDTIGSGASGDTETITISSLAAGTYMLNVNYNTGGGIKNSATYSLVINGVNKCPN